MTMTQGSGLYEIVNTIDGKRYYGSSIRIGRRWSCHRTQLRRGVHGNPHLQAAWAKHGESAFAFRVLALLEPADLADAEARLLSGLVGRKDCYNVVVDSRAAMRGRSLSPAHKAALFAGMRAFERGSQWRQRLSDAQKALVTPEERERRRTRMLGRKIGPQSAEHRAKGAASRRGKKRALRSAEWSFKCGSVHRGKPWSAARRAAADAKVVAI